MAWTVLWCALLIAVAFAWSTQRRQLARASLKHPPLTPYSYSGPPADPPMVSILIAGKDEEANIERAVRSFLNQDYPNFELIVINDRSRDRTPQILESLKAQDTTGRLRVLHITELRDGWFGKNNAMREGVAAAHGQWFCFSDADCCQTSTNSLSMAVRHALHRKVDFLSMIPTLEMNSLWELIIQPVASLLLMFWFNPKRVNRPHEPTAYANGAFMLMTRRCYEVIGGHDAVKTELNEDVHMARLAKERGQLIFVCRNDGLYTARMYTNFAQIWRGWSRIFYGCFGNIRQLAISVLMLLSASVIPYLSLFIAAAVIALTAHRGVYPGWYFVAATAALAIAVQSLVLVLFYRACQAKSWQAFTFAIGSVACVGMLFNAMLKLKGRASVTWRGTTYRGDSVVTPTAASAAATSARDAASASAAKSSLISPASSAQPQPIPCPVPTNNP